jgi:hypothetical protein
MAPTKSVPISKKIINAAAQLSKGTTKHVSRKKVAQMCGFGKEESRSYKNQITILKKKKEFIVLVDDDTMHLTEKGLNEADPEAPAATNDECLEAAKSKIKMAKGKKVIDLLSDGKTYTRAEIGEAIGSDHTQRSFSNILGPLKTLGFIDYVEKNGEKACVMTDDMFPFGRPADGEEEEENEE